MCSAPTQRGPDRNEYKDVYLILAICTFVVGMGAFAVVGMLEPIADGLNVPVTAAGSLLTVYSIAYAVSSPILVALTGRIGRRRVLVLGLAVYMLATLAAALVPGMALLYPARVIASAGAGMVTPVALAIGAALAPPERRGQALASVFLGVTLSQVAGVPAGSWLSYTFGWRSVFLLVVAMSAACIWLVWTRVPEGLHFSPVSLGDLGGTLRDPVVLATVSFTVLFLGASFTVYTYLPALLSATMGYGREGISLALLMFGAGAPVGNLIGGRMADGLGPARSLTILCVLMALFSPVFALLPMPGALLLTYIFAWSVIGWCYSPSQQLRLVSLAPQLASVLMSLHAATVYIGIAAGSGLGGLVFETAGLAALGPAASGLVLVALGVLLWSERAARSRAASS